MKRFTWISAVSAVVLTCFSSNIFAATNLGNLYPEVPKSLPLGVYASHERLGDGTIFIDAEKALNARYGIALQDTDPSEISAALIQLADSLPENGAIELPRSVPCGYLDFRRIADGVQITGGWGGTLVLGAGQRGIAMIGCQLDQIISEALPPVSRLAPNFLLADDYQDARMFAKVSPASDLVGLFCDGGLNIKTDIKHCAWIACSVGFGSKVVTADARVDDSLFLWFSINWPFQNYNAHQEAKSKGKNWLDGAQMWFNCKGGGEGTRLYEMIETNYGNPAPGVVLENCAGMSVFHGSTERPSSQGPGVYWLKNCKNVQLGLRAINSFSSPGHLKSSDPEHDLTIEGGEGNVLYGLRAWAFPHEASIVNSDPKLQAWMASFQFDCEGLDKPDILRFCYNENLDRPSAKAKAELQATLKDKVAHFLEKRNAPVSEEYKNRLERMVLTGRATYQPYDASQEQTFVVNGVDLTTAGANVAHVPPPPSIPATNAPRLRRPVEFTQAADFGKAVLDAGADPTGLKPADDAFAKIMYGMTRAEVEKALQDSYAADREIRAARDNKDDAAKRAASTKLDEALALLQPQAPADPKNPKARRPKPHLRLDIPAGTFLFEKPLVFAGQHNEVWGAGPDKTVLKTQADIKLVELHDNGAAANLTLEGGRVGLAITGSDHGDPVAPTLHAYIAGRNFYNIVFKNQTFAGIHVGNDQVGLMGGSEHDQNKYVDLHFVNTGEYGIYMNNNMLDKWLCLHCEFSGQKKAGISIKFNNLIHGAIVGGKFENIDGPGIDIMGGNPEIAYRPWLVMVDQCEFTECGSAAAPAVDLGYGELMSILHSTIVTKNKTIHAGFIGSPQVCQDVKVDVKTAAGDAAMVLRAVRNVQTARVNGHVYKNVECSGALKFVNDSNAYNALYAPTLKAKNKTEPLNWDVNPAAHENAPKNGWVHPFLFYNCSFGEKKIEYSLVNADVEKSLIKQEIALPK